MNISTLSSPFRQVCAVAVLLALAQSAALAQVPATPLVPAAATGTAAVEKPKPLSPADKKFIKDTAKSFYFELQLAAVAKDGAASEGTKKYAELVNKELNKGWEPLSEIAKEHGEMLPTELTGGDKSAVERLKKTKGDGFDKLYLRETLKEAKAVARDFESAVKTANDPAIKTFVTNYLATVKGHLSDGEKAEKAAMKKP